MNDPTKRTESDERPTSSRLEAWLAGDLAPGSDEERALLAQDPGLVDELERHRALRAAVRELPGEIEPSRDLWPGVEARIAPGSRRPWLQGPWRPAPGFPLAAALAAALAVAIGAVWLLRQTPAGAPPVAPAVAAAPSAPFAGAQGGPQAVPSSPEGLAAASELAPTGPSAAPPLAAPRATSPPPLAAQEASTPALGAPALAAPTLPPPVLAAPALAAYAETDRQLAALGAELRRTIEARQERLPPATRQIVFDNLATIERALAEIETALAGSPGDVELARTYIEYRQREISVLRRANAMAARL